MSTITEHKCPCGDTCHMLDVLKIIGGKWKIPIICSLAMCGDLRYSELMKKIQGLTNTMLASSLKDLERDGLVNRVQYNEMPIRVEYSLTEKSQNLVPILVSLAQWNMSN